VGTATISLSGGTGFQPVHLMAGRLCHLFPYKAGRGCLAGLKFEGQAAIKNYDYSCLREPKLRYESRRLKKRDSSLRSEWQIIIV